MATFTKAHTLLNVTRSTTNANYVYTEDRFSLWRYDSNDYDGVNWIKHACVMRATSGDTAGMIMGNYADTVDIASSECLTTSTVNVYVVSNDIKAEIVTNNEYRSKCSRRAGTAGSASFDKSLILVNQTDPTKTVTIIDIAEDNAVVGTSYSAPTDYAIWQYDGSMFDGTVNIYLEADLHVDSTGDTCYCALYDITGATQVSSSEVSHTGTTLTTRKRSGALTLTSGRQYRADEKGSTTTADLVSAKIIIKQSNFTKTACYLPIINGISSGTESTYTAQNRLYTFNASEFVADTKNFYHEATLKVTANTGYARLYNETDATELSVLTTTSTSYERKRSTALTMPTDDSNSINHYRKRDTSGTVSHSRTFLIAELVLATNVTVNPTTLTLTTTLGTHTATAIRNVTVSPTVLTTTLSLGTHSIKTDVSVSQTSLSLTAQLLSPTISAQRNVTVNPTTQTATIALNTPTVTTQRNTSVNTTTQTLTLTFNHPTVTVLNPDVTVNVKVLEIGARQFIWVDYKKLALKIDDGHYISL